MYHVPLLRCVSVLSLLTRASNCPCYLEMACDSRLCVTDIGYEQIADGIFKRYLEKINIQKKEGSVSFLEDSKEKEAIR